MPQGGTLLIELVFVRIIFVVVLTACAYFLKPFQVDGVWAALGGLVLGGAIIVFETRVKQVSLKRLIGGAVGSVAGIFGAFLMSLVIGRAAPDGSTTIHFIQICILLWMTYVGLVVGASKGDLLNLSALGGVFGGEKGPKKAFKILDTSVIIDGRIADIADTGFLDGVLVIPQFVFLQLQFLSHSSHSLNRNRPRP